MGYRRDAREKAVQFLYQHEFNAVEDLDKAVEEFWAIPENAEANARAREFADALIRGVFTHREESDAKIKAYSENWDFHRISPVDKNVMRLAIYEMLHRDDIPPVVSINEAVEIAKRFSTAESGKFVNGILDKFKLELTRPFREAAGKK
ncbi:transcription antitermination factor NusB [Oscillatoria amoena NRMC-F 0135]|nr:transcription antitermination factor NusB [Oscillatoria laete-virens]MDL5045777.1 transcription antitermination factor NusB [Oscillatoria amoena NRMC-F 0135]MDL5055149.1 transcription antitermination factor NusB [Oscillatoria laete-virens NRMC-F 0139]